MNMLVSALTGLLVLGACATTEPPVTSVRRYVPGAHFAQNLTKPGVKSVGRSPAAETHDGAADLSPASNKEAAAVANRNVEALSAMVRAMQEIDPLAKKLKDKIGANRFQDLINTTSAAAEQSSGKAFRDAYVAEFPDEADKIDALIAQIVATEKITDPDLNDNKKLATYDRDEAAFKLYLRPQYLELSKGLVLPENAKVEDFDSFLEGYYGRLIKKVDDEKMSAGLAFALGTVATENMPPLNMFNEKVKEQSMAILNVWKLRGTQFVVAFSEKFGTQNFFQPLLVSELNRLPYVLE